MQVTKDNWCRGLLVLALRSDRRSQLETVAGQLRCEIEFLPVPLEDIYRLVINGNAGASE